MHVKVSQLLRLVRAASQLRLQHAVLGTLCYLFLLTCKKCPRIQYYVRYEGIIKTAHNTRELLKTALDLLMVRSLANPSSLSTQRSATSFFIDLEEVRGDTLLASDIVTIFSKSSIGLPSAVHRNLARFSYIT